MTLRRVNAAQKVPRVNPTVRLDDPRRRFRENILQPVRKKLRRNLLRLLPVLRKRNRHPKRRFRQKRKLDVARRSRIPPRKRHIRKRPAVRRLSTLKHHRIPNQIQRLVLRLTKILQRLHLLLAQSSRVARRILDLLLKIPRRRVPLLLELIPDFLPHLHNVVRPELFLPVRLKRFPVRNPPPLTRVERLQHQRLVEQPPVRVATLVNLRTLLLRAPVLLRDLQIVFPDRLHPRHKLVVRRIQIRVNPRLHRVRKQRHLPRERTRKILLRLHFPGHVHFRRKTHAPRQIQMLRKILRNNLIPVLVQNVRPAETHRTLRVRRRVRRKRRKLLLKNRRHPPLRRQIRRKERVLRLVHLSRTQNASQHLHHNVDVQIRLNHKHVTLFLILEPRR